MNPNRPRFPSEVMVLVPRIEPHDDPTRVIGRRTAYRGTEHPYLRDSIVVVLAVFKNAVRGEDHRLDTEAAIEQRGGVGPDDRIEVAPWLPNEGRLSFVTSDPKAIDLDAFARRSR